MDKVVDIRTAIMKVNSGDTVLLGGFTNFGQPLHLVYALAERADLHDLCLVTEDMGYGALPYKQGIDLLYGNQVNRAITSFIGPNPLIIELRAHNKLDVELVPQGTLAERIRAAGVGFGGFYTPTGVGTVVEEGKEVKEINGKKYVLELPLPGDVALVKAWKADRYGNAVYKMTGANFNTAMAMAGKTVILEVEEVVEPGEIEPDQVQLPGLFVDYVVECKEAIF